MSKMYRSEPNILPATGQDLPGIYLLNPGLDGNGHGPDRFRRALDDGTVLIAAADGEVVGLMILDYSFFDRGFVDYLVTHPDRRRRGIGAALMHAAIEMCDTRDLFTSTNESNQPMQALLDKLGFEYCGTVDQLDPGDPERFYVFHKESR